MSQSKYIFSISIMKRHMRILIRWLQIVKIFQTVIPDYHMYSNPVNTKIHRPSCSAKYLILSCHSKNPFQFSVIEFHILHVCISSKSWKFQDQHCENIFSSSIINIIIHYQKGRIFTFIILFK